jgi:hypothetical protein
VRLRYWVLDCEVATIMDLGTEIEKGGSRFHTIVGKILHHNTFNGRDKKWQFIK